MRFKKDLIIAKRRNNFLRGIISILRVFPDRDYILTKQNIREKAIRELFPIEIPIKEALKRDWLEVGNYFRSAIHQFIEEEHISSENIELKDYEGFLTLLDSHNIK